jgi:hypothetical protein
MRVPALAVSATQTAATVAVFGYGEFGQATAGLLAATGHRVRLLGGITAVTSKCQYTTQDNAHHTAGVDFETPTDIRQTLRHAQCIVASVNGTEYGALCEDLVPVLSSGQTLYLVGAAFGAALEVEHTLGRKRSDLALNIVEVDCPFNSFELTGSSLSLSGVKSRVVLAGRSLNETRTALSEGASLFSSLVPASNLLERGFANIDRWLQTASILFEAFAPPADELVRATAANGAKPLSAVLASLRAEIQLLAKAYGVSRLPDSGSINKLELPMTALKRELGRRVIEDFIILSSLARIVYLPLPILESVIELSSVVTGLDLRKEGRQLSDLGLIGMDAHEIIEHVSA